MSPEFWTQRRVLVTGHTGFKGAWLTLWLERLGAKVAGYALAPPTEPSLYQLAGVESCCASTHGDVRDLADLKRVMSEFRPEVVFHLAAQSVVRESYADPLETYSTNVMGTACVCEAIRSTGLSCTLVNVTTDKCYKNHEWLWGYRESDELGGRDPYSNSKACSELVTQSFRDSFFPVERFEAHGVALATARAGNVIGGGDWTKDQLIPDVMRAFDAGKPVSIRSPKAVRPWQHVLDCLSGYLRLAEKLGQEGVAYSGAYNFGPDLEDTKTVAWIVDCLATSWGQGATWTSDPGQHPHEAGMLRLDNTKAISILDWQPRLSLPTALEWTTDWYRAHFAGEDARQLCLEQLEQFMALGKRAMTREGSHRRE